jgi:hypothetical protein
MTRFAVGVLVGEPGGLLQHLGSARVRLRQAPAQIPEVWRRRIPRGVRTFVHRGQASRRSRAAARSTTPGDGIAPPARRYGIA